MSKARPLAGFYEAHEVSLTSLKRSPHILASAKPITQARFDPKLIAPCGMNCAICKAHLRKQNPCHGCNFAEENRPKTRVECPLRVCRKRSGRFCCGCPEFPCDRLRHLDQRYRTTYGMSQVENLKFIKAKGLRRFVEKEGGKWFSKKGILCVHDKKYYR